MFAVKGFFWNEDDSGLAPSPVGQSDSTEEQVIDDNFLRGCLERPLQLKVQKRGSLLGSALVLNGLCEIQDDPCVIRRGPEPNIRDPGCPDGIGPDRKGIENPMSRKRMDLASLMVILVNNG